MEVAPYEPDSLSDLGIASASDFSLMSQPAMSILPGGPGILPGALLTLSAAHLPLSVQKGTSQTVTTDSRMIGAMWLIFEVLNVHRPIHWIGLHLRHDVPVVLPQVVGIHPQDLHWLPGSICCIAWSHPVTRFCAQYNQASAYQITLRFTPGDVTVKTLSLVSAELCMLADLAPPGHWVAEVQTSAFGGAGTSANVYMVLHGERGSSSKIPLQGHNVLQRGSLDMFHLPHDIDELGHLVKMTLGHDNQVWPAWHVMRILLIIAAAAD